MQMVSEFTKQAILRQFIILALFGAIVNEIK